MRHRISRATSSRMCAKLFPSMKVLIAPNAFKGTYGAVDVCHAIANVFRPHHEIMVLPVSDGGDGFIDCIHTFVPEISRRTTRVCGPVFGQQVEAEWLWDSSNNIAYIESAQACGLSRLGQNREPMLATSYGLGELILAATDAGAEDIYIGLGGTACTDGGIGALTAMGWAFLDQNRQSIGHLGGGGLIQLAQIVKGRPLRAEINLMVDVSNQLLGDTGTAPIFAPQKGASPEQCQELERCLSNLWLHCYRNLKQNIDFPGAGAAGGIPAGFSLMQNVSIGSGFELIADLGELEEKMAWCDVMITGEGAYDAQSQMGKAPGRLVAYAKSLRKKTAIIAGHISVFDADYEVALQPQRLSLNEAAEILLAQLG